MKKAIIIVLMCAFCYASHTDAQTRRGTTKSRTTQVTKKETFDMDLETDGRFKRAGEQQFFVVNFPGKTASQLYSDVLAHIAQVYVYPDRVTDKAENRSIIINGSEPEFMELTGRLGCLDLRYRIEIQFKDGRLRINMPEITKVIIRYEDTGNNIYLDREDCVPRAISCGATGMFTKPKQYFKTLYGALAYGLQDEDW